MPDECGEVPGGQFAVAAVGQAVEILHQPGEAAAEGGGVGSVPAHQRVGTLHEGPGRGDAEFDRAAARPRSLVRIGPRDHRCDRLQLRRLGQRRHPLRVAEIAGADHADGAVRAGKGGSPPYGVVPVALLVRPRLPRTVGGEPAAGVPEDHREATPSGRQGIEDGDRQGHLLPVWQPAEQDRTRSAAAGPVDIRAQHRAVTHLRGNVEIDLISVVYRSSGVATVVRGGHATAFNRSASTSGRSRAMKWPAFGTCVKPAAGSSCLLASRSEGRDQSFSP